MPTATTTSATAAAAAAGNIGGGDGGSGIGSYGNTYNNPYGSSSVGGGSSSATGSGSYYGQTSSTSSGMYATPSSSTQQAIPPALAFGTTTSNSMMSGSIGISTTNNVYDMGGPIGGGETSSLAPNSTAPAAPKPHVFDPRAAAAAKKAETSDNNNIGSSTYEEDYDNEPPLLEELGVNFPHIYSKSRAVLFPFGKHAKSLESGFIENDADLAGPLAFALGLGGELLLSGKLHFGYVYGFGVSGCLAMTFLLNLLNPNGAVSMWTVISILGYALLPVNLLAGINMILRVHKLGLWGMVLAVLTIVWCTTASARLFERGCNMRAQRFLVAYPTALLYSAFVIITIF
jgi:hypothetical protein